MWSLAEVVRSSDDVAAALARDQSARLRLLANVGRTLRSNRLFIFNFILSFHLVILSHFLLQLFTHLFSLLQLYLRLLIHLLLLYNLLQQQFPIFFLTFELYPQVPILLDQFTIFVVHPLG